VSEEIHDLILWLDKPVGILAVLLSEQIFFSNGEAVSSGTG
jgi:hypothetical protein